MLKPCPNINVLPSVSRVRSQVTEKDHQRLVTEVIRLMAAYRDAEDLIQIGAYVSGKNPDVDRAIRLMPLIRQYLCQSVSEAVHLDACVHGLAELLAA